MPKSYEMPSLNGKEILVIDDADEVRILAQTILRGEGASVAVAATVDQGLEQARKRIPHLIVTDLAMPGKNGFDFLAAQSKDPALKGIPTIVLSSERSRESVLKAASLGAAGYLLKPFRVTQLLQLVRKTLKLTSFASRKLDFTQAFPAELSLPGEVVRINETGFELETPVKLPPDEPIRVTGDLLKRLELEELLMRTVRLPGSHTPSGGYLYEVNFVGIDQRLARLLRTKMTRWK